jgi:hypothetical protein
MSQHNFTKREREVFPLILARYSDQEIADHLGLRVKSITHIVHAIIHDKMGLDGGRGGFFAHMFEELDTVVRDEDRLIEQEKMRRGVVKK